jgi:hypothetical protein
VTTDPEATDETLEDRLANLIPEHPPEDEETRAALQARMMDIFTELNELAEVVEDMTRELLASYGMTLDDIADEPLPSENDSAE